MTQLAELDRKISSLVAAVEAGADLPQVTEQLKRRAAEREVLDTRLGATRKGTRLAKQDLVQAVEKLGG